MPEPLKIYLDQMLRFDVAQALRGYKTSSTIFTPPFFRAIQESSYHTLAKACKMGSYGLIPTQVVR
jgi:hypothetical protein